MKIIEGFLQKKLIPIIHVSMSATARKYIPGETQIIAEKLVNAERLFFGKEQNWLTE